MIKTIKGEILLVGSKYLDNSILITNPKKEDIILADELSNLNGKKVKITIEAIEG